MTIPASAFVQILPGVINAGGTGLVLNGMMLTNSWRVPMNSVLSFATAAAVGAYFGLASQEYAKAVVYFAGFVGSSQLPGSLLVAQYNQNSVAAWMRSGSVASLTIAQLQAISGTLTLTVDGYPRTASALNLSSATSFTAAATLIATALNTTEPTEATVTASIAAGTPGVVVGSIANDILTVTSVTSGTLVIGAVLAGSGVTAGTQIVAQDTGTTGGVGTYAVSVAQTVPAGTTITGTFGTMTVTAVASGTVSPGQTITGGTTAAGTVVTAYGTGTGLTGTYIVNLTQTVTSGTLTAVATNLTVTYDSTSGAFVITSGIVGTPSLMAASATGTTAAALSLTAATGAVVSQGANAATPSGFMASIVQITQNWATFFLLFDPDGGVGNTQKLLFAAWTSTMNNRYAFLAWDTDITPTLSNSAPSSMGAICVALAYNAVVPIYDPTNQGLAAFVAGIAASVNFNAVNGRVNFDYRSQAGLVASVTNQQTMANLVANGYNCYVASATANQSFVFLTPGSTTGIFLWLDSLINQIWLNNQFQLNLMTLLTSLNSIPYNAAGYAMIPQACMSTIQQALLAGVIRAGVPLSSGQAQQVNNMAGYRIDDIILAQGWYFQVQPATP